MFCYVNSQENDESRTTRLYIGQKKKQKESNEEVKERSPPPMKVTSSVYICKARKIINGLEFITAIRLDPFQFNFLEITTKRRLV